MRALLLLLAITAVTAARAADSLPAWTRPRSGAVSVQMRVHHHAQDSVTGCVSKARNAKQPCT